MGENSAIEWTDHTFNPWEGCEKVSPGCKHCYAEARNLRFNGGKNWGPDGVRRRTVAANWSQPLRWNRDAFTAWQNAQRLGTPLPRRHRVFCASLADVFEDREELKPWRADLLALIQKTPWLDWQLLTKRPQNIVGALVDALALLEPYSRNDEVSDMLDQWIGGNPPANVWLGTTVENNEMARERIPHLLAVDAAVRFISCEPLLERTTLGLHHLATGCGPKPIKTTGIDWVIIGGESGDQARPFHTGWARKLVQECYAAGVRPFVKQLGRRPVITVPGDQVGTWKDVQLQLKDSHGGDAGEWPVLLDDLRVREFPR